MELSNDRVIELFQTVSSISAKTDELYRRLIGDGSGRGEIDKLNMKIDLLTKQLEDEISCRKELEQQIETREAASTAEDAANKRALAITWGILGALFDVIYHLVEAANDWFHKGGSK